MYNAILSSITRDDYPPYLDEWVEYHLSIGFEHIVMYDHKSIEPVQARWGDKVTVIRKDRKSPTFPNNFHNETFDNFKSKWIGVISVDEFIVIFQHSDIHHLLSGYEEYGGLSMNWAVYGSSGHKTRPSGYVKDNYVWRLPHDDPSGCQRLVKTIVNTEYFNYSHNPHTCLSSRNIVTEDFVNCNSALADSSRTLCRINHYITRSLEDYRHKINVAKIAGLGYYYNENGFYLVDDFCSVYDDVLKDYGKPKMWESIEGWFNFNNLYTDMVGKFNDAVFVEIGGWKGKSSVFMADKIKNSGRNIKFFVVDIWSPFIQSQKLETGSSYEEFIENIEPVKDYIIPIKGDSLEVFSQFEDNSIDFLFIDSCHDYQHVKKEIALWFPKVKSEGIIAGHDYDWDEVKKAVDEYFVKVEAIPNTGCWLVNKADTL